MGFNSGHSKSGGRRPGAPNRRTEELVSLLEQFDYSPVAELISLSDLAKKNYELASDPAVAASWLKIGVQCATSLMPYVYPKLKPLEQDNQSIPEALRGLSTDTLIEMAEKAVEELKR